MYGLYRSKNRSSSTTVPTFSRSPLPSPKDRVNAPIARAVRREEQEDETEQDGGFAMVLDRPETLGLVELKVRHRHLA